MTKPVRLQLSRRKGFDLQAASQAANGLPAVNVARPTKWGNPCRALPCWYHGGIEAWNWPSFMAKTKVDAIREGNRIAVEKFRRGLASYPAEYFEPLRGKNLACWCKPELPCHADALLEIANRPVCEEVQP